MNYCVYFNTKKWVAVGLMCIITQSIYSALLPEEYFFDRPEAEKELAPLTDEQVARMSEEEQIAYSVKLSEQEEQKRQVHQETAAQELQEAIQASQQEKSPEDVELEKAMILSEIEHHRAELRKRRQQRTEVGEVEEEERKEADYVCLDRNQLFENIMGMREEDFKSLFIKYKPEYKGEYAPADQARHKPNVKAVNRWFLNKKNLNKHPRSYAILHGELFPYITLKELRKTIYRQYQNCPMGTGTLSIITPPDETDIRRLHELYPNAFFMIASNFNALEGGMGDFQHPLNAMNHTPVQGEEATLATMGAAIHRRYLVPRINQLKDLSHIFKLQGLSAYEEDLGLKPFIQSKIDPNKPIRRKDMEGFAVTLHKDIIVTSGASADPSAPDRQMIPRTYGYGTIAACNKQMPTEGPKVITVSHILASAHDLSKVVRDHFALPGTPEYEQHTEIAKAVLEAAYEATLLTAMEHGADQLILTLIGAKAFRNDAKWIITALEKLIPLIVASNIDIKIVLFEKNEALEAMMRDIITKIEQYKQEGDQSEELNRLLNI